MENQCCRNQSFLVICVAFFLLFFLNTLLPEISAFRRPDIELPCSAANSAIFPLWFFFNLVITPESRLEEFDIFM